MFIKYLKVMTKTKLDFSSPLFLVNYEKGSALLVSNLDKGPSGDSSVSFGLLHYRSRLYVFWSTMTKIEKKIVATLLL